ncbi:MAG: hypothetical protein WBD20_20690 [Pirellulaceae bacterium]
MNKFLTALIGLCVVVFIGSLFIWSACSFGIAAICLFTAQWGLAAIFGLAAFLWLYAAIFFVRLPSKLPPEPAADSETQPTTVLDRRVGAVFGIVSGGVFGLSVGVFLMAFVLVFGGPQFMPVGVMFGIVCLCTLLCYALPNVGPEVLSQLEIIVN